MHTNVSSTLDAIRSASFSNNKLGPVRYTLPNQISTVVLVMEPMDIGNFIDGPGEMYFVKIFEAKEQLFEEQGQEDLPSPSYRGRTGLSTA